jgi:hypothetical protein
MRLINNTGRDTKKIEWILRDLGIHGSKGTLIIETLNGMDYKGTCMIKDDIIIVLLRDDAPMSTVAHELKHVEQIVNGLNMFMKAENKTTVYKDRWHEIEAREYGALFDRV